MSTVTTRELNIDGSRKVNIRRSLRELWGYRSTILAFAERNIRVQYKQAVFSVAWVIIQPLSSVVVLTVILGHLAHVGGGGVPYASFALSSQVAWTFLSSSTYGAAGSATGNSALIRKVYFSREVPGIANILSASVNLGVVFLLFLALGPVLGAHLSPWVLTVPLLCIPVAVLGLGVGLAIGAFNVYYRDFGYLLSFVMQIWFYVSPVAYPMTLVPPHWRPLYVGLNPAAGLFECFRRVLTLGQPPSPTLLAVSLVQILVVSMIGYRIFKRLEPLFADVA